MALRYKRVAPAREWERELAAAQGPSDINNVPSSLLSNCVCVVVVVVEAPAALVADKCDQALASNKFSKVEPIYWLCHKRKRRRGASKAATSMAAWSSTEILSLGMFFGRAAASFVLLV